tara:strand:- start:1341 stop:2360 length:1020 start_codon:yes stop_codon:yes gene_type:complete
MYKDSITITEKTNSTKDDTISIRAYFNPDMDNMGLEKYNMTLFEGVYHHESITCLEKNGIRRYLTGLNEYAPEVKSLTGAAKEEKVKEIRSVVAQLEKELATNMIDEKDPEFWSKVKIILPDNDEFWGKMTIKCGNDPVFLDPKADPYDLIKIYAIKAGGFSMVAPNLETAKANPRYKFYLDERRETVSERTKVSKLRNKALGILSELYDEDKTTLLYVTKMLDFNSTQYTDGTPIDVLYEVMDAYINGNGSEKDKSLAARNFIKFAKMKIKDLKLNVMVKDLMSQNKLTTKADGYIYDSKFGARISTTKEGVVEYLKNPKNEETLLALKKIFDDNMAN